MIRLEKVNKYFNHHKKNEIHVINNTSLTLPDKGLVALLGPSGCGKTTLLNTIGGLDKVNNGKIYINNQRITHRSTYLKDKIRNLNIGYIFQNYYLIDDKSVYDNVAISLKMIGIKDKEEIKKRVNYVLEIMGMYRYRNRPANMLSGGERQRVGIARAIAKNPSIIIADEPTGNLDSTNTIEIMNIIKSISKERLVILVTHENDIAKFYADRILEIEDGIIQKDYDNKHNNNLDYREENKFYLKDFKYTTHFENKDNEINIFNDKQNDIKLTIVVKNNNIYIKGGKNDKIEVVDNDSNISFINNHYKQIDKTIYEKYEFNFNDIIDHSKKLKYSSIFNPITFMVSGFKKILDYSFLKKLLLLGFFASGCFINYAVSNSMGITNIKDKDFIVKSAKYYDVNMPKLSVDKYNEIEKLSGVNYILPGDSKIAFKMNLPFYYQTSNSAFDIVGSLDSIEFINKENLISGRMPENDYELVIDKLTIEKIGDKVINKIISRNSGFLKDEDYLDKEINLKNMKPFKIVGITDLNEPSIYANKDLMINMLYNSYDKNEDDYLRYRTDTSKMLDFNADVYFDYTLVSNIKIKWGRLPENDYEVIMPAEKVYEYNLNSKIDKKINDQKLMVVGFYENKDLKYNLVNSNTIKYQLITSSSDITVMSTDENLLKESFATANIDIHNSYDKSLKEYKRERKSSVKAGLVVCAVIISISFIEIYLMIRSSFLSRIKEIGIYRAIGVKRLDICKMFYGEIFAITTIACIPGILFVSYCLSNLTVISYFAENYLVNIFTIILSIILTYLFNLFVGLLPVIRVLLSTPAAILSRKDLD